ncbi:MAG TPA: hypothetical protein VEH29_11285 [Acidimicrobiales bacterium]|nr:hypothetical protein [Acidimicrobiales bacterium]
MHGSRAPQVRRRAAERVLEAEGRALLARLGQPEPIGHPVEELLKVAAEDLAWLRVLRERLAELPLDTTDRAGVEREAAVVSRYERALERNGRVLTEMARMDVEVRLRRLDEARAEVISRALQAAISRSGLPSEYVPLLKDALVAELRAIEDRL